MCVAVVIALEEQLVVLDDEKYYCAIAFKELINVLFLGSSRIDRHNLVKDGQESLVVLMDKEMERRRRVLDFTRWENILVRYINCIQKDIACKIRRLNQILGRHRWISFFCGRLHF